MTDTTQSTDQREEWRPVVGFEGFFEVSSFGRVRSLSREITRSNGIRCRLKGRVRKSSSIGGYPAVNLQVNGVVSMRTVHVLVAAAFIGPRPEGMEVAHGDGVKENNHYRNLRYATPRENQADRVLHGTSNRGAQHPNSKLTSSDILSIREAISAGQDKQLLAERFGVHPATIRKIHAGRCWKWLLDEPAEVAS